MNTALKTLGALFILLLLAGCASAPPPKPTYESIAPQTDAAGKFVFRAWTVNDLLGNQATQGSSKLSEPVKIELRKGNVPILIFRNILFAHGYAWNMRNSIAVNDVDEPNVEDIMAWLNKTRFNLPQQARTEYEHRLLRRIHEHQENSAVRLHEDYYDQYLTISNGNFGIELFRFDFYHGDDFTERDTSTNKFLTPIYRTHPLADGYRKNLREQLRYYSANEPTINAKRRLYKLELKELELQKPLLTKAEIDARVEITELKLDPIWKELSDVTRFNEPHMVLSEKLFTAKCLRINPQFTEQQKESCIKQLDDATSYSKYGGGAIQIPGVARQRPPQLPFPYYAGPVLEPDFVWPRYSNADYPELTPCVVRWKKSEAHHWQEHAKLYPQSNC